MRSTVLASAILAFACAGCASFDFSPRNTSAREARMGDYFASRLEAGRLNLKQGNLTKSIEAFRQASYDPETAPEAFNGMAVAYSMLGRNDVARDLFMRAIEKDPTDQRYWRNLARVDEQIMLAQSLPSAQSGTGVVPVGGTASSGLTEAKAPAQVEPAKGVQAATLRTARAKETFITTSGGKEAASVTSLKPAVQRMAMRPAGVTAVRRPAGSQYPIRIELTPAKKPAIALRRRTGGVSYPIRVALDTQ